MDSLFFFLSMDIKFFDIFLFSVFSLIKLLYYLLVLYFTLKVLLNCLMIIVCSFIFNNESPKVCLEIPPMGGVYILVFFAIE